MDLDAHGSVVGQAGGGFSDIEPASYHVSQETGPVLAEQRDLSFNSCDRGV